MFIIRKLSFISTKKKRNYFPNNPIIIIIIIKFIDLTLTLSIRHDLLNNYNKIKYNNLFKQ